MKDYADYEGKVVKCDGIIEDYREDKKYFQENLMRTCSPAFRALPKIECVFLLICLNDVYYTIGGHFSLTPQQEKSAREK